MRRKSPSPYLQRGVPVFLKSTCFLHGCYVLPQLLVILLRSGTAVLPLQPNGSCAPKLPTSAEEVYEVYGRLTGWLLRALHQQALASNISLYLRIFFGRNGYSLFLSDNPDLGFSLNLSCFLIQTQRLLRAWQIFSRLHRRKKNNDT